MTPNAEHADALGFIVLYGTTDKHHVTYSEALAAIEHYGVEDAPLPAPTKTRAYSRAAAENETRDRVSVKFNEGGAKVTRFFRKEREEGTRQVEFPPEGFVAYDSTSDTLTVEGEDSDEIRQNFDHFSVHVTGDDIRQMTRAIVERLDGISLRGSVDVADAGGTYFVPIQHRQQLDALAHVLEELHVGYLRWFVVMRGEAEQLLVFMQAQFTIERQIADILRLVGQLTARVSAAVSYRRQLDRLAEQLRDYSNLTGQPTAQALQKKLDRATKLVDAKIAELTPKKNKPKTK